MLRLTGGGHDLGDFGFRHLERIDAAQADAGLVDLQHDFHRVFGRFIEERFKDLHNEIHRRVVVVEEQHLVKRRSLQLPKP